MSRRSPRSTRRSFLTDFGAAGFGVVILGACAGSSSGDATPATDTDAPEPSSSETPVESAPVTEPATTDGEATDGDAMDEAVGPLQLQHVSLGFVSAYVLVRGNEATIVDTGTADSRGAIFEGLAAMSVGPEMVRHIVLTHNHGDHIGGLSGLEGELTNATVHAGPGDIDSIQTTLDLSQLNDGDEVFGMGVVGTPGHTPGSISLFDVDTGILVAGDAIGGDGSGGITGPNADFTPDLDTAAASVAKLAALEAQVAAFGHGGAPVTDDVTAKLAALV